MVRATFAVLLLFMSLNNTNRSLNSEDITCKNDQYGSGGVGDISTIGCNEGQEGSVTAVCLETGEWKLLEDTCILVAIQELLIVSEVGGHTLKM